MSEQWLGGEVNSERSVPQKCAWMGVAVCLSVEWVSRERETRKRANSELGAQQGGGNGHGEMPYLLFYHSAAKIRLKSPSLLLLARISLLCACMATTSDLHFKSKHLYFQVMVQSVQTFT